MPASARALPIALLLSLLLTPLRAQEGAKGEVPLERLPARVRPLASRVAGDPTARCEVPERRVRTEARIYRTLLARLPLAARMLRALDLGDYAIEDASEGRFTIDDRLGAQAVCERALEEAGLLVVVARGRLEVPVLPRIQGTGLIVVRYGERTPVEGAAAKEEAEPGLRCSAEVAFRLENDLLHRLSRPLRSTLQSVLQQKLADLIAAATALSELVAKDPSGVAVRLEAAEGFAPEDLTLYRQLFLPL